MTLSGQTRTCKAGEHFDSVALEVYGDERYAADLLCANPAFATLSVFHGGETLVLPVVEVSERSRGASMPADAPWKE